MNKLLSTSLFLALAGIGLYYPASPESLEYALKYNVIGAQCQYLKDDCSTVSLIFNQPNQSVSQIPLYVIEDEPEKALTKISFQNIGDVNISFVYENVMSNPLIDQIDYQKKSGALILNIFRKGPLGPVEAIEQNSKLILRFLKGNKNYPFFSQQQPDNNSIVYPSTQKIRTALSLSSPLKKASLFLNGQSVPFDVIENESNQYLFEFDKVLKENSRYLIKAIVTDEENRSTAAIWEFEAQMPMKRTDLSKDRFKYLGWWGQINANQVSVREKPTTHSEQLGTLSTANRVKVLDEVNGESIDSNNLWYQIDGGKYPGAYIFSRYVTSIVQPKPPDKIPVLDLVKPEEYWIDVNLTDNVLTLFEYDKPVFVTYISTGRPENPTATGTYYVWFKAKKERMTDGPPAITYQYDLLNVPYVFYYHGGYAIHGTYWHDKFGSYQSAGCTNLTQGDAQFLFENTKPQLLPEEEQIKIEYRHNSTMVYNHY